MAKLSDKFTDLFLEHVASSFDKQLAWQDFLGQLKSSSLSMQTAELVFTWETGKELRCKAQVLGQERPDGWIWSWDIAGMPESLVIMAKYLQAYGAQQKVPELTERVLDLSNPIGNMCSMIAIGALQKRAYYRVHFSSGPAHVVIDEPEQRHHENLSAHVTSLFPQLLSTFEIPNHQSALLAYLRYYKFDVQLQGSKVSASHPSGKIVAEFDDRNRLVNLNTELVAARSRPQ
jgi:hypothetical protein